MKISHPMRLRHPLMYIMDLPCLSKLFSAKRALYILAKLREMTYEFKYCKVFRNPGMQVGGMPHLVFCMCVHICKHMYVYMNLYSHAYCRGVACLIVGVTYMYVYVNICKYT